MGLYKKGGNWYMALTANGRKYNLSTHTSNKRLALKILAERLGKIAEGRFRMIPSSPPRLEEFAAEFLDSTQNRNTKRRYRSSVRNLVEFFKTARLSQVPVERIEEFKQARLKSGVRSATVNRDLAVLRRMMKLAARRRLIAQSPFDEVEFLEERKQRRQPHILSFQEQGRLMTVASALIRVLVVLLTEAGLRVNKEGLALRWEDADFLDDVIHVRQSKTPAGRRNIPMSVLLREELLHWKEMTGARSAYVFPNPRSSTGHLRVVRKTWATTLKLAGIPYFPIYNLRATFASRLSAAGAPDNFVAQMLGHSASSSILQTYAKAVDEYRRDAIRRLEVFRESYATSPDRVQKLVH